MADDDKDKSPYKTFKYNPKCDKYLDCNCCGHFWGPKHPTMPNQKCDWSKKDKETLDKIDQIRRLKIADELATEAENIGLE